MLIYQSSVTKLTQVDFLKLLQIIILFSSRQCKWAQINLDPHDENAKLHNVKLIKYVKKLKTNYKNKTYC